MSKLLSDLNELVAGRLTGEQSTGTATAIDLSQNAPLADIESMERVGWIVYAMETGETNTARRYAVIAHSQREAVEHVLDRFTSYLTWDEITFEVFRQGQGVEFRYEHALREVT